MYVANARLHCCSFSSFFSITICYKIEFSHINFIFIFSARVCTINVRRTEPIKAFQNAFLKKISDEINLHFDQQAIRLRENVA